MNTLKLLTALVAIMLLGAWAFKSTLDCKHNLPGCWTSAIIQQAAGG